MKINNYKYLIAALILVATSCKKSFLDTFPTTAVSADDALASTKNAYAALNGIHRIMYVQYDQQGEAGEGPRDERPGVPVPLRPAGGHGRRVARRPPVQGRPRVEEAAGRGRGGGRAEPGPAVDGLRHRGAGAVLRPGRGREGSRRREGEQVRRPQPRPRARAE